MPTFENYTAFLYGINKQLNSGTGSVDPKDVSPGDPAHLLSHHVDLLADLQHALKTRKDKPADALAVWERIHPILVKEVNDARSVMEADAVNAVEGQLHDADRDFIGAAYHSAEEAAEGRLEAPDIEEQKAHFERAEEELLEAKKLWENASTVMAEGVDKVFGLKNTTKDVIELVELPGTIQEKMEKAKDKGMLTQAGTAVELVGKIKAGTLSLIKISAKTGERYCAGVARLPATQANKALLKEVEEAGEQWKWLGETAETLGTAASVISVIGDGMSLIDAIRTHDWKAAASAAEEMVTDAAPIIFGADVAAPLAGVVVLVKAELYSIHAAAEFIRYCKDEQVREATGNYVKGLVEDVHPWASQLAANVEVMLDPTQAQSVQGVAMDQINRDAEMTWQGVRHVTGVYLEPLAQLAPAAYESMGYDAINAFNDLSMPAETKEGVIALAVLDKVEKIFHGANLMAKYVQEHYTN